MFAKHYHTMSPQTGYRALKVLTALFALNGFPGLLVSLLALGLDLVELLTGVAVLPHRSQPHATIDGVLAVLAMAVFWALELATTWLVWFRPSRLAIYLALGIAGLWAVIFLGIVFEVLGVRQGPAPLCILLGTAAVVCWPCLAAARWLSAGLFSTAAVMRMADPGAAPNGGSGPPVANSEVREVPPIVS